jgi:hypothetical protein
MEMSDHLHPTPPANIAPPLLSVKECLELRAMVFLNSNGPVSVTERQFIFFKVETLKF